MTELLFLVTIAMLKSLLLNSFEFIPSTLIALPLKLFNFNDFKSESKPSLLITSSFVEITNLLSFLLNSVFSSWLIETELVRFCNCSVEISPLELQPCKISKVVSNIISFFITY